MSNSAESYLPLNFIFYYRWSNMWHLKYIYIMVWIYVYVFTYNFHSLEIFKNVMGGYLSWMFLFLLPWRKGAKFWSLSNVLYQKIWSRSEVVNVYKARQWQKWTSCNAVWTGGKCAEVRHMCFSTRNSYLAWSNYYAEKENETFQIFWYFWEARNTEICVKFSYFKNILWIN